jgi:eukaryotic-like serine/threonine-protein kinase
MSELDPNEEVIFNAARQFADAEKLRQYLDLACEGKPAMRQRIERLLGTAREADSFFGRNAVFGKNLPAPAVHIAPAAVPPGPGGTIQIQMVPEMKPGDRIGRYKLLEQLGEGGCGVVYVAEQEEPVRRRVALKVIKLGMDTREVIARFEAERQALALMDHPHIAKVLDAGATESGRPFFVMELVKGIPITRYCDEQKLDTHGRLNLFIQVCQAVQHAHQKGIIHRDLKPSNILVADHDGVPVPKVIDFGIAKATTDQRLTDKTLYTAIEQFIGTPAYMSPEQANLSGLDIDTRSDIYSLGVLLYELLTGCTPFDAQELVESGLEAIRRTIREVEPPRPSTRLSTMYGEALTATAKQHGTESTHLLKLVRGDLDWIVMKCLEKDRARRYETANGLAADLKRHLNNEPVVARPPSAAYKFQKAFRRNKLAFSAGVAVVVALVAGLTMAAIGWHQALKARAAEEVQRKAAQASAVTAQEQRHRAEAEKDEANHLLYVANMNVAQAAWDENNFGRLRQVLEDTATNSERGFEWYYWQRLTHLALKTLRGHTDVVWSVAFSRDGQRIVTASADHTAKVWDAATGRELLSLRGHRLGLATAAFSPDGQRIVTAGADRTAKVWDAATGKELLTLRGHTGGLRAAFSPDGRRIVTGSADHTAKVWDAATGKELLTLTGHTDVLQAAVFSPDGLRIVTGSEDKTAIVWDAATGKRLLTLSGHTGKVSASFSPDGTRILTGSSDHTAKVWDAATGKELQTLRGHTGALRAYFSPDGQRIVTASTDQTAKVWDAASGTELLTIKGHNGAVYDAVFSPDGQRIVTAGLDHTAMVWDASGSKEVLTLIGHSNYVDSVSFSPNGKRIVTGSFDNTAKIWDVATGSNVLTLIGHAGWVGSGCFSPDGKRILTGSWDNTAKVWDAATGQNLRTLNGNIGAVFALYSPDGRRIVTAGSDWIAKLWETASDTQLSTIKGFVGPVFSLAISPDSQRVVIGDGEGTIHMWDAATGHEVLRFGQRGRSIDAVAISADGLRIATGSLDGVVQVSEAATGRELMTLKGHSDGVSAAVFSPDGQRIVTASGDYTAKMWDTATGRELLTLNAHSGPVVDVAFSRDGNRIATADSWGHTAIVWEAATTNQVAAWQEEERVAAQHLADLKRERLAEDARKAAVRARESIKQWLVLAPIPLAAGQSGADGLDIEQIKDEGQIRPRAGESISIGGSELKWRQMALTNEVIDFNEILGQVTEHSVAYAVTYIESEADRTGLVMLVGSDDQARIYLNQREIYRELHPISWEPDRDTVPGIELKPGVNVLVFKVVNELGGWSGSVRFTDSQGDPVKGLTVTLDPEAKE